MRTTYVTDENLAPGPRGPAPAAPVHLIRRPVFDNRLCLAGYDVELAGTTGVAVSERALAEALTEVLSSAGVDVLAGPGSAFLRPPASLLVEAGPSLGAPGAVVLEVTEDHLAQPAVREACAALAAAGHTLCLAGRQWSTNLHDHLAAFRLARVDVSHVGTAGVIALAARMRTRGLGLFVEGVETLGALEAARRVGADFVSGRLVSRPPVLADRAVAPGQLACLRLVTALARPEADLGEVEMAVRSDPGLTMRVLKTINSAGSGRSQRVSSIRQAVVMLGPRAMLACVLSSGLSDGGATSSPEAVESVLVRARMCELASRHRPGQDGDGAFMVGLLSGLDVLLGADLREIVTELPLDASVEQAVLTHAGPLGAALVDVLAYESCLPTHEVDVAVLRALHVSALSWTAPFVFAPST